MNNLEFADAFVAGLAAAGLRQAVLAPGARSSPFALALLRRPEIACEVITDERVAGYFALGMARASGQPAAVLCTSGTAAANLMPAVMEAGLGAVPLLALTADRPPEAHGWGANQTADQTKLYGDHVRAFHALPVPDASVNAAFLHAMAARLMEECMAPLPGPVHANIPFREPLLPEIIPPAPALPSTIRIVQPTLAFAEAEALARRLSGRPGVIVCGELPAMPGFADALARLGERLDVPIVAGPLSGLRFGSHDKSRICARPPDARPDWVLRFGGFPIPRAIERWLAQLKQAEQILVASPGRWPDPLWQSGTLIRSTPQAVVDALLAQPLAAAPAGWWKPEAGRQPDTAFYEGTVVRTLVEALPEGGHCFVGNSLAIRAMDAFGGTGDKTLTLHGNRGASGIDGNFATVAGIAAASDKPTAVLLGDQAALHDCGGLYALRDRNVVVVLMDNGGGGIFEHLPLAGTVPADLLARGWLAPPQVDFRALAAAFGLNYAEVAGGDRLAVALAHAFATGGAQLIRVIIDRAASRKAFTSL